jgi:hypothetical protein
MREEASSNSSLLKDDAASMQGILEQLSRIHHLQNVALQKKDQEIEQLQSLVQSQQNQLQAKEEEVCCLERERYRHQEERALELRSLF